MRNPSAGSCLGGCGRPGDGTVPIGAALTTIRRRTPAACIAWTIAPVPRVATLASALERAPRPDSTASAPATADSRAAGSTAARSAVMTRTSRVSLLGLRTTAVTSWPAVRAWSSSWRPMPPVAAKIVSFMLRPHVNGRLTPYLILYGEHIV